VIAGDQLSGHVPEQFGIPRISGVVGDAGPEHAWAFRPYVSFADIFEVAAADAFGERGGSQEYRGRGSLLDGLAAFDWSTS
jgi:hypothetical protein